jgi:hypothetical protein
MSARHHLASAIFVLACVLLSHSPAFSEQPAASATPAPHADRSAIARRATAETPATAPHTTTKESNCRVIPAQQLADILRTGGINLMGRCIQLTLIHGIPPPLPLPTDPHHSADDGAHRP